MSDPITYDHGGAKVTTVSYSEPTGVKPVIAWAVADREGVLDIKSVTYYSERADETREKLDRLFGEYSPFRVIRVRIVPDTEEQK